MNSNSMILFEDEQRQPVYIAVDNICGIEYNGSKNSNIWTPGKMFIVKGTVEEVVQVIDKHVRLPLNSLITGNNDG